MTPSFEAFTAVIGLGCIGFALATSPLWWCGLIGIAAIVTALVPREDR